MADPKIEPQLGARQRPTAVCAVGWGCGFLRLGVVRRPGLSVPKTSSAQVGAAVRDPCDRMSWFVPEGLLAAA